LTKREKAYKKSWYKYICKSNRTHFVFHEELSIYVEWIILLGGDVCLKSCLSLGKVGKVTMSFYVLFGKNSLYPYTKTYIDFMLNQEEYFSDSVRDGDPLGRRLAWC